MKNLLIYDMSAIVYHGVTDNHNDLSFMCLPIDGVYDLLKRLSVPLSDGNDILIACDHRSFRKDILSEYKSQRIPNRAASVQFDFLYDHLEQCGIPIHRFEGYEADDVIYWACSKFYDRYESIIIQSNDIDVTHNVRGKVRFKPTVASKVIITENNFANAVVKGETVPFNTISAHKVFFGCSSDSVPAFKSENKVGNKALYSGYIRFLEKHNLLSQYAATSSSTTLAAYINSVDCFTDNDKQELYKRLEVIYPAEKPEDAVLYPFGKENLSSSGLRHLCEMYAMCRDYGSISCLKGPNVVISDEFKQSVLHYKDLLKSGAYSVDHNLEVDPSYELDSELFSMKEF